MNKSISIFKLLSLKALSSPYYIGYNKLQKFSIEKDLYSDLNFKLEDISL